MKKSFLLIPAAISAAVLAVSTTSFATSSVLDGDWNTPATWDTNTAPPALPVGVVNGNTVTFSSGSFFGGGWANGVIVGTDGSEGWGAGSGNGTLNVTGGLLDTGYLGIGQNNTGIVNVSGGTFQSGAEVLIGWSGATSSAVNVTGGTVNFYGGNDGVLGQGAAATMSVSGTGIFDVNRNFYVRNDSIMNVATGGTMNVNFANGGQFLAQKGVVNVNGGAIASTGTIHVGYTDVASLNITSGTVTNTNATYLGFAGGAGTVTQSGGTATYQDLYFGNGAGTGTYNLSNGTATVNGTLGFGVFGNGGAATINQTGGTLELASTTNSTDTAGSAYNLQGGTFRALGNVQFFNGPGAFPAVNVTGSAASVVLDTNGFNVTTVNGSTFNNAAGILTKTGSGTFAFGNGGSLTISNGQLNVAAGTLQTDGGTFIAATASVGGNGTINGNLNLASGADFVFSLTDTLTVNGGTVSFGNLSILDIAGLNSSVADGTYSLMDGNATFDYTNVQNFGSGNAFDLGGGMSAYFDGINGTGLQVTVVPEPTTWALLVLGFLALVAYRKRAQRA